MTSNTIMIENSNTKNQKEFNVFLTRLPFQIFLFIAESDDKINTAEWMTLIKMLKEKKVCQSPYARGVLGKTEDKLQTLKLGYERGEIKNDPKEIKKTIQMIQNCLKEEEALTFEDDMEKFAMAISEASSSKSLLARFSNKKNPNVNLLHQMIDEVSKG